jgi:hypothetical protein
MIICYDMSACIRNYSDDTVRSNNPVQSSNPIQSYNPVFINNSTTQRLQTLCQPQFFLPIYLDATRQHIENFNSRSLEIQSVIRDTTLTNSTHLTQQRLPENDNSNVRTAATTSLSPPSYDDALRLSSVIIPVEHEFLLPPSYDAFMLRNNERYNTDF